MRVSNTVIGLMVIVLGAWVIWYARGFPKLEQGYPGPSLFPTVLAVLFILAGTILIVQDLYHKRQLFKIDATLLTRPQLVNIALVLSAILFYIFVSDFLGFQITSFIVLAGLTKRLRVSTFQSLAMAGGVTFFIYVLFAKLMLVPLPWGLWGW